jgi:hypothetical protein
MTGSPAGHLLCYGSLFVMVGLLAGVPLWLAVIRGKDREVVRAWRVAHTTITMDGILLIALGLLLHSIPIPESASRPAVWALVSSGFGFVWAMVTGAWKGIRGLTPKPYGLNTLLFAGHVVGAAGSLVGMALIIYGFCNAPGR